MDPEAMQATQRLIRQRVPSLELVLSDSMVRVTYPREEPYVLLFVGWGSITELFMPAVDGRLLTVTVEAELGRGRPFEVRRVFTPRSSGEGR